MGLAAYKQIRFLPCMGTTGNVTLVINRPTYENLSQPATDTLELGEGGDYYPFIVSGDFALSKKFTTTRGRRALDDLNVGIRDGLSYTGEVNEVPVSEDFTSSNETFFDVWFNDTRPYKAFLLYTDNATGATEVTHGGWIDPTYNPSSDAIIINPLTSTQVWLGTRTIKMTAIAQAQLLYTWKDVLTNILQSDTKAGTPYNGFMMAPTALVGQTNTRADLFSSSTGQLMQAVTYKQKDWTVNPACVKVDAPVWPLNSFLSTSAVADIAQISLGAGGTGYAVNDTGTINGTSGTVATYQILSVGGGGAVLTFQLTGAGSGYSVTMGETTTATSGVGSGFQVNISKVGTGNQWGPSGLVFISLTTLFSKIALTLGINAPTVVSALKFWLQKWNNIGSPPQNCFPIGTSGVFGSIVTGDLYLSLNVFAKCHPYDGSYWDNPVGWSPTTPITDVLKDLCNMLLADFNITSASDGTQTLVLTPMGTTSGTLPNWPLIGSPQQEEPATVARIVQAKYKADDLVVQSPLGIIGDSSQVEIPARIHRIGKTSGVDTLPDKECLTWDEKLALTDQADNCFKISWFNQASGETTVMPDCWKSLCYLYWFNNTGGNPGIYPSNWTAFDGTTNWSDAFFVVNAITKAKNPDGSSFTSPTNLQAEINGNDYFNLRNYTAVAFASLTLPKPTVQTLTFNGIADSGGSIQNIKAGLSKQWRYGGALQNWVAIQIDQLLLGGQTTIKFQQYPNVNGFPSLTDLSYGVVGTGGGTSSTTGSATGGSISGSTNPKDNTDVIINPITNVRNDISDTAGTPLASLLGVNGAIKLPFQNYTVSGTLIHDAGFTNTNGSQYTCIKLTGGTADFAIDSVANPLNGTMLLVWNATAFKATFAGSGGTAANRFSSTSFANVLQTVFAGGSMLAIYDGSISRWRILQIFPIPNTAYDSTYFTVSQASDGHEIVTLSSGFVSGVYLVKNPQNNTDNLVQSTVANITGLDLRAKALDSDATKRFIVSNPIGLPQMYIYSNGDVYTQGSLSSIEWNETLLAGNNNDLAIGNTSFITFVLTGGVGAPIVITGFIAGYDGQILDVVNNTGQPVSFSGNNAASAAANQISLPPGIGNLAFSRAHLRYSTSLTNWVVISVS